MPPGQEGKITLAIEHTESYSGEVMKSAQVVTNDPANLSFQLVLRAYFKGLPQPQPQPGTGGGSPVAIAAPGKALGPFTVSPSDRWNTSALTGSSSAGTLHFYNNADKPVRIKRVVPGGTDFTATLQTIQEGKRYELSVATNSALKPGQYKQTVRLLTDSKATPEMHIELAVTVYPRVFVTPSSVVVPALPATGVDVAAVRLPSIYVRKLREGGLKLNNVVSSLPFIKVNVRTETEGQVYVIELVVDKAKITGAGEYRGKIRIETNDAESPVFEVSVYGSFT